ncbi:hypothetical protein PFY10_18340 [Chryseobacterium daecheongense]|nr:hypothetical protein PFY10_18340 [Chryseobacterium daecheongense]
MIPENLIEFLYWVKENTETLWSEDLETSGCEEWIHGAKWIPLTDQQIDEVEKKYSIQFTPEHKEFLRILHTIDKKEKIEYTEDGEDDAETLIEENSLFYNWLQDDDEIKKMLEWPYRTICEDVIGKNQVWLKSWGKRPSEKEERKKTFTDWYNEAPKLVPMHRHRFVVGDGSFMHNPVLSIWGSDIIVYGWNLRTYLLNELKYHLDIYETVYDETEKENVISFIPQVKTIFEEDYIFDENKHIPFWEELILLWTSGWSSFGLKFPGQDDSSVFPIMRTYIPEDGENQQKTFDDFK